MAIVWIAVSLLVVVTGIIGYTLYRALDFRSISLGWKLLSLSGLVFFILGIQFILSWQPVSGPFHIDNAYPFGSYLRAWIVSMGFTMVAYGISFIGFTLLAARIRKRQVWMGLFFSWLIFWLPHAYIAISLFLNDSASGAVSSPTELVVVATGGLIYLGLVTVGFYLSGRESRSIGEEYVDR
jgi:hypothetical protein